MVEVWSYEVISREGRFEIREYPTSVLATVRGKDDYEAFGILFQYISGSNSRMAKVPMTAPVVSTDSQKIPMTAPVVSEQDSFSFVMPAGFKASEVPEPLDRRVSLEVIPRRRLAVLRFRGRAGRGSVATRTAELLSDVRARGLGHRGEPFLMRYNPPITPGFMRRNEVAVELEPEVGK